MPVRMAVGQAEGHKTRVRKKNGIGEFDEAKTRKRVFISSLSWLSPQLARRRDVPADMTPGEDERVEPVDLEDGSALLSRDGPSAASDAGVRLPAFGGDVAFLERLAFGAPLWAWVQLAAAVLAISTAGIAFDRLPEVPPLRLASWRMQATSALLLVGARREWRAAKARTAGVGGSAAAAAGLAAGHAASGPRAGRPLRRCAPG